MAKTFFWRLKLFQNMGVSKKRGSPKSSTLIRFSIISHPFWDTPIFGSIHIGPFTGSRHMLCCCWRCPQGFPKALATRIGTRAIPSSQCFFRPGNHPPKIWPKKSDLGNSYQPTYVIQISMLHPLQVDSHG